jgi:DNA-binding response OmpR family regulator
MSQILFVDDDKITLKLVKGILEGAGYTALLASDPREALEILEKHTIDALITDANMPGGISGFDLVKTVKNRPEYKALPTALLTGRREKKDIAMGLAVGADDYIIKPIDPLILLGKIESLLKRRPAQVTPTHFPERPVRLPATWDVETQITTVSERGLTLWSAISAPVDGKIKIKSEFFKTIGIEAPILRVVGFSRDPSQTQTTMYFINTIFIGLTDTELQKIRQWLITNPGLANKPKAS